jgi:hypothetical protein
VLDVDFPSRHGWLRFFAQLQVLTKELICVTNLSRAIAKFFGLPAHLFLFSLTKNAYAGARVEGCRRTTTSPISRQVGRTSRGKNSSRCLPAKVFGHYQKVYELPVGRGIGRDRFSRFDLGAG